MQPAPIPLRKAPSPGDRSLAQPDFNAIARPYRWLEYLTFGPFLQRCRRYLLPDLHRCRRALVLGDGDGRFLAELLRLYPHLEADAVDLSPVMLHLLRHRSPAAVAAGRLRTHLADARSFLPLGTYDLVVTHFFLDCLTSAEVRQLSARLLPHLSPRVVWILSEFRIPGGALRAPARALVHLLYLAFRLLTHLRVSRLPDHASALAEIGLTLGKRRLSLGGLLTSELWRRHPASVTRHPIS